MHKGCHRTSEHFCQIYFGKFVDNKINEKSPLIHSGWASYWLIQCYTLTLNNLYQNKSRSNRTFLLLMHESLDSRSSVHFIKYYNAMHKVTTTLNVFPFFHARIFVAKRAFTLLYLPKPASFTSKNPTIIFFSREIYIILTCASFYVSNLSYITANAQCLRLELWPTK